MSANEQPVEKEKCGKWTIKDGKCDGNPDGTSAPADKTKACCTTACKPKDDAA